MEKIIWGLLLFALIAGMYAPAHFVARRGNGSMFYCQSPECQVTK
jgi:hypothetical protein